MTLAEQLARTYLEDHATEAAQTLERLSVDRRTAVLRALPAPAARAIERMTTAAAAEAVAPLTTEEAATVLHQLPIPIAIALLRRLGGDAAARAIAGLPDERREALQRALDYPEGTAGALMDPGILALPDDIAVAEARLRLRRGADGLLHYLYVVNRDGRLVGVLDIPELMRARPRSLVRDVMHDRVEQLSAWAPAAAVRAHPGWRLFHALPVTDEAGRLVGAIRYQTVRRLEQELDTGRRDQITTQTVGALGEPFHLGIAGIIEGVAAAATPREASHERS
jgi:magnesium transporter